MSIILDNDTLAWNSVKVCSYKIVCVFFGIITRNILEIRKKKCSYKPRSNAAFYRSHTFIITNRRRAMNITRWHILRTLVMNHTYHVQSELVLTNWTTGNTNTAVVTLLASGILTDARGAWSVKFQPRQRKNWMNTSSKSKCFIEWLLITCHIFCKLWRNLKIINFGKKSAKNSPFFCVGIAIFQTRHLRIF